jgi:N-acyl-D-amino-acid deacylase
MEEPFKTQLNKMKIKYLIALSIFFLLSCKKESKYDLIIKNGLIYDGNGGNPTQTDIAIKADTIAFIGDLSAESAPQTIDAEGKAVSPGFVNILSWSPESLIHDGRGLSELTQGVTLQVMGEGESMGPITDSMQVYSEKNQGDIKYKIQWKTLGEYLNFMEKKGIACNIASFVGASSVRAYALGYANRQPSQKELELMKKLVRQAMEEGAMGVASALIYVPGVYSDTHELIELSKVASEYGGTYISHIRSEGNRIDDAVNEVIEIAKKANIHAEIYHLKAAGKQNWHKLDKIIAKIDSARSKGLNITTDMYNYVAGATGLDASMPPWVQEGGLQQWRRRLQSSTIRERVSDEMAVQQNDWENLGLSAGADGMLLVEFKQDSLKKYTGKTLAQVAKIRGKSWQATAMDLVVEDDSRVGVVYFLMSEENVKKQIKLPYMSFCSDAAAQAPEGIFLKANPHPRSYGNFTRLLGKYVRDEKVISLQEAIRKLTSLPCDNLKIQKRGRLKVGNFADIVIFDPKTVGDKATFEKPHQLSEGVSDVIVNGKQVLKDGKATNVMSGRVVRGPGYVFN